MKVRRIGGSIGEPGTAELIDGHGRVWQVPVVRSTSGKLLAAQNEYESGTGVDPSWELRGDMNDAVEEFFRDEG